MKRKSRATLIAPLLAALLGTVVLAGCGGSSATGGHANAGPLSVDYSNVSNSAQIFQEVNANVQHAAKVLGYQLRTYDNNFDAQTALRNAQIMVNDHPQVIIEWNGVAAVSGALERQFTRADIPCITINTPGAGHCHWFDLDNKTVCGDTARVVGQAADMRHWTGANTTVILADAAVTGPQVNSCIGYFYQVLQGIVPGLARISSYSAITPTTTRIGTTTIQVDGQGALAPTYTAVRNVLSSIPASRNIILYTVGDDETIGGWQALQREGRASHVITAGTGGTVEGIDQLRTNPAWVAEGDVFLSELGEYVMAMATAIKSGDKIPFLTTTPMAVLTRSTTIPGTTVVPLATYFPQGSTNPSRLPPLQSVAVRQTNAAGEQTSGNSYLASTGVLQKFGNVMGLG